MTVGNDRWIGRTIGAWTIEERIGEGGMGAVFKVRRTDGAYGQHAAMKVMSALLIQENAPARFRAERQILANLDHPYIARLIDGGTTDDHLPYLVMDYVEGDTINVWAATRSPSLKQRLEVFIKICEGVDHAHRNLVVHRDLKPGNILITPTGEPRLLDFGIAKLLAPDVAGAPQGLTGEVGPMTTEYASPEQVRGQVVSVATDIYTLGVLLFRLLTGQSPYGERSTTQIELQRAITDSEPSRPSTAIGSSPIELDARAPQVPLDKLRRSLAGDLDNIVLKCLQKDPDRRYRSAQDLADDITRHLQGRPVEARGDNWAYKLRKYASRNRAPIVAGALALGGVIAMTVFHTTSLARERDRAQLAAAEAEQVSSFLADVFRNADPYTSQGAPMTALELLDSASLEIDALDDQPRLQARLLQVIGDTYTNLLQTERAIGLLERAETLMSTDPDVDQLALASLYGDLSEAYRLHGDAVRGEVAVRRMYELRRDVLPADDDAIVTALTRIAVNLSDQDRKEEALDLAQQALAIKRRTTPEHDSLSVDILGNTAHMLTDLGRYAEAEAAHRETMEASERIDGQMDPNTVIRLNNVSLWQRLTGQFDEALATMDESLDRERVVWPEETFREARWIGYKARILSDMGLFEDAMAANTTAMDMIVATRGQASRGYGSALRHRGYILRDQGRLDEAEAVVRQSLDLAIELDGEDSVAAMDSRTSLARIALRRGQPEGVEAVISAYLATSSHDPFHLVIKARRELAVAASMQGRDDDADSLFEALLQDAEIAYDHRYPMLATFLADAARHDLKVGRTARALERAERAHDLAQDWRPQNWQRAVVTGEYAHALKASGQSARAIELAREAQASLRATVGKDDPRTRRIAEVLD